VLTEAHSSDFAKTKRRFGNASASSPPRSSLNSRPDRMGSNSPATNSFNNREPCGRICSRFGKQHRAIVIVANFCQGEMGMFEEITTREPAAYYADYAVIESRWEKDSNLSVKPVFDLIAHTCFNGSLNAIPYERFLSERAFEDTVKYFMDDQRINALYIGCHADQDSLQVEAKGDILFRKVVNVLRSRKCSNNKGVVSGLFFGSCSFCTLDNVVVLMKNDDRLKWVAGYSKKVDWGLSTFLDGLFMMEYTKEINLKREQMNETPCRGHYGNRTYDIVTRVAERIKKNHRGLAKELGFEVFARKTFPSQIQQLIALPQGRASR